jgi:cis-3-alkyl-4-acyloxetan-2-one decarboxylase
MGKVADRLPAPAWPAWLERLAPFERYRIDVGGFKMHVMEAGEGLPVFMLHGNPTWGFLYRKVAHHLRDAGLRLIMPDLVGLGFSDKPRDAAAHSLLAHAGWTGKLMDALELERMVFVGQDWGGPIGMRALADRPERLAGLVLMNTVVSGPKPGFKPTGFHRFSQMPLVSDLAFRVLGFPQSALWFAQSQKTSVMGETGRAYRYPLARRRERVAPLALARMVPDSLQHPSVEDLEVCRRFTESYRGPAALVWGDRDPILGRVCKRIAQMLPQAEVVHTQAGHFLQEEVPEVIADAVRRVAQKAAEGS